MSESVTFYAVQRHNGKEWRTVELTLTLDYAECKAKAESRFGDSAYRVIKIESLSESQVCLYGAENKIHVYCLHCRNCGIRIMKRRNDGAYDGIAGVMPDKIFRHDNMLFCSEDCVKMHISQQEIINSCDYEYDDLPWNIEAVNRADCDNFDPL